MISMNQPRGRRKKDHKKVYSSVPPSTHASLSKEATRRGLDVSDVIRETLIERFGQGEDPA